MGASESEILEQTANDVFNDIRGTIEKLGKDVQNVADLEAWVRHSPWLSVEAALAAGFFAAGIIKGRAGTVAAHAQPQTDEQKEKGAKKQGEVREAVVAAIILPLIKTMGWAIPKAFGLGSEVRPAAEEGYAAKEEHPPFSTIPGGRTA